jgi:hypothetical protein
VKFREDQHKTNLDESAAVYPYNSSAWIPGGLQGSDSWHRKNFFGKITEFYIEMFENFSL